VYLLVGSFGLWVLVTSSLHRQELALGVVVSLIVTFSVGPLAGFFGGFRGIPQALAATPAYLVRFVWKLILANLDVARRVLSPTVPVQPGIVAVRTSITSDIGRLLLANSITLTPGTLTLDAEDDTLYVHWIEAPAEGDAGDEVAGAFEAGLKGVVE
jgi:multicomponent Na+:H+ antiporter subunit E